MRIMSKVCAEFSYGEEIFTVTPDLRFSLNVFAPDWIREDPLFALLVKEGTLEVVETKEDEKRLEKDPESKPAKSAKADKSAKSAKSEKQEKTEKSEEAMPAAPAEAIADDGTQPGKKA